ncbi:iron-containing alcohol dehydrogenase [Candidatus Micrarchaeota archaeon]|nr:iron-containing alcohol dehydrogenase [Candidatus Micrarchaeota archaeon]MBU2476914.1 iron-containing alcohol dehydrogenase [Candidatus Micrarchaeota archaeon]
MISKNNLFQVNLQFGRGSLNKTGEEIKAYGDNALIVPAKNSMKRLGFLDKLIEILESEKINSTVFEKVEQNPTVEEVDEGIKLARDNNCNLIIGIGGGSSIDTAKGIAIGATHFNEDISTIWDFVTIDEKRGAQITNKILPTVAITSTSGTGSHVTPYSVITNKKTHEKPGIYSPYIVPTLSIVDINIVSSMPKELTAVTGFDALCHAMESFVAIGEHPISDLYALKSVELISENLDKAYNNGDDINARTNMALADTLAGLAISTSRSVLPHSMAHSISGHYPMVQHGMALACITLQVMKFNLESNDSKITVEKYAKIAELFGKKGTDKKELALKSIEAILEIQEKIGIQKTLSDLPIDKGKIEIMTNDAFRIMKSGIERNPRKAEKSDVIKIYEESF